MIRLQGLSKAYGEKCLLEDVSFHFTPGRRYGLVGPNGAGKSTLLEIISGDLIADGGGVIRPSSLRMAHLPQVPNPQPLPGVLQETMSADRLRFELLQSFEELSHRLASDYSAQNQSEFDRVDSQCRLQGAYRLEADARELLAGLGFRAGDFVRNPLEFSGGWRMRIELAKLLLQLPDFLILDEPTNHLDIQSIAWVERRLLSFEGVLLFVSHDRDLLTRLATHILHLNGGRLREYPGDFDHFLEQDASLREQRAQQREKLGAEAKRLESFATRFGAKASMAARARSKLKMAERLRALESGIESETQNASVKIELPSPPPSGRMMLEIKDLCFGRDKALAKPFSLSVLRGHRLALIGPNGVGKSTLVGTLVGDLAPVSGERGLGDRVEIAYFAQEQAEVLSPDKSVLATLIESGSGLDAKRARSLLGALGFSGRDVEKPVGVLSGGETNRVGLACLLSMPANFLVLDEPTNHLDMASVEVLAEALTQFEGAILFVSHNRAFVNEVCTHVLAINDKGEIVCSEGNLEDYEAYCLRCGVDSVLGSSERASDETIEERREPDSSEAKSSWAKDKQRKRERERIRREIDKVEKRMEALEHERITLSRDLEATNGTDFGIVQRLGGAMSALEAQVARAEENWFQLNQDLEALSSGGMDE